MTHKEWMDKNKPARGCSAQDLNFGGECFNCGYPGESVPPEVKRSEFGCKNCLWYGVECKDGSKYAPKRSVAGNPSCMGYNYYD